VLLYVNTACQRLKETPLHFAPWRNFFARKG